MINEGFQSGSFRTHIIHFCIEKPNTIQVHSADTPIENSRYLRAQSEEQCTLYWYYWKLTLKYSRIIWHHNYILAVESEQGTWKVNFELGFTIEIVAYGYRQRNQQKSDMSHMSAITVTIPLTENSICLPGVSQNTLGLKRGFLNSFTPVEVQPLEFLPCHC